LSSGRLGAVEPTGWYSFTHTHPFTPLTYSPFIPSSCHTFSPSSLHPLLLMLSYPHALIPSSFRPHPLIHSHLISSCSYLLCSHPLMLSSPHALVHSSIHKLNPLILSSPNALVPKLSRPLITSVTSSSLHLIPSSPTLS